MKQIKRPQRYEIRFSGSGGQGVITLAMIFAEAVGIYGTKYVCQTQSYGPEARGGKSKAEVVISSAPIDYPKAVALDLLLAMNQSACDAYFYDLKANGILVVDKELVQQLPTSRVVAIPFTRIAEEKTGLRLTANMVALGVVGMLSGQIDPTFLEKTLLSKVPEGTAEINRLALQQGIKEADEINLDNLPKSVISDDEL